MSYGVQFNIADSEVTTFSFAIGPKTAPNTVISAAFTTPTVDAQYFIAVTYAGAGKSPSFYFAAATGAVTLTAIATNPANGILSTAPSCNNMVRANIGNEVDERNNPIRAALNDFKIYNFALSIDQIQARYNAETGNFINNLF